MPSRKTLSVVVPCLNEQATLAASIERLMAIRDESLALEVLIVDDGSTDRSIEIAREIERLHPEVRLICHERNRGKGATLRTGFAAATGDFVAAHDADLEYDPRDLRRMVDYLLSDEADVVFGSRFLSGDPRRVLYFWHQAINTGLTVLSNMFTDLCLTDMETCYKAMKREVAKAIVIEEDRFGVEPELVAKIARQKPRIYEVGISYRGRTYEEGKKIGIRDAFRAVYCVFHYNAPYAPIPIQFLIYFVIGGISAVANLVAFAALFAATGLFTQAVLAAFVLSAAVNYLLCLAFLFRHRSRWGSFGEIAAYAVVVAVMAGVDLGITSGFVALGMGPLAAKAVASALGPPLNYLGRRWSVFKTPKGKGG